jgi:hypothetical protein
MAKMNPVIDKNAGPLPNGIELPQPAGVSRQEMEMPEIDMKPNDGDQKDVAQPAFASGKDLRNFSGGGSKSDPTPAMPGA